MKIDPSIDILLATFNGGAYLGAQLDSLLSQTYPQWTLLVRDDGSQDDTLEIIRRFRARCPDKVTLLEDRDANLGARSNFARLLTHSRADYIMLCDQDDVWLPHKIKVSLDKMTALEKLYGQNKPLLVHTDVKVVGSNLQEIAPSLWQYQKSDPEKGSTLKRLLLQNVATGCTIMINKSLLDRALPVPEGAMMHDWWLALVAAAFGHIGQISGPTLLYRQHERSDIGAKSWNYAMALRQLLDLRKLQKSLIDNKQVTLSLQKQAEIFLKQFGGSLHEEDKEMIDIYAHLSNENYFMRRYYMIKYGFFYTDPLRNLGRLLLA